MSECRHGMNPSWCADCKIKKMSKASRSGRKAQPTASQPKTAGRTTKGGAQATEKRRLQALVERRARGLQQARHRRLHAQGDAVADAEAQVRRAEAHLAEAQNRLRQPTPAAPTRSTGGRPVPPTNAERRSEVDVLTERGTAESGSPLLDPDLATALVWVLPRGGAYHRRDCHVVEDRPAATPLASKVAKQKGLRRCEHCSPLA